MKMWLTVISSDGNVTNANKIVPTKNTANDASKSNEKQQLSASHDYNTCKILEHNYAAYGNPDDADTKESYEPELLEKYEKLMSAWKDDMLIEHMSYMVKYMCDTNKHVLGFPKNSWTDWWGRLENTKS